MRKIKNRPENELTITKVAGDSVEFTVQATGKINFNQWFGDKPLSQYREHPETLAAFLLHHISTRIFDSDTGIEVVSINECKASQELRDAFESYAAKYLELKTNRENKAKTKEIQDLENRLNELKRA